MGLSRIKFIRKLQNFPTCRVFCPQLTGFPLALDISARARNKEMMGLPDGPISFKIDLTV